MSGNLSWSGGRVWYRKSNSLASEGRSVAWCILHYFVCKINGNLSDHAVWFQPGNTARRLSTELHRNISHSKSDGMYFTLFPVVKAGYDIGLCRFLFLGFLPLCRQSIVCWYLICFCQTDPGTVCREQTILKGECVHLRHIRRLDSKYISEGPILSLRTYIITICYIMTTYVPKEIASFID
jgi:hypothetical protein